MSVPGFVWVLLAVALFLGIAAAVLVPLLRAGIRIVYQYEKGLVFFLGRYQGLKEPGLRFLFPVLQKMTKVDMRMVTAEIPRQEVLTRDNINLNVDAVVYYRVSDPQTALVSVYDYNVNTVTKAQAVVRDVIGSRTLDEVLQHRAELAAAIKESVEAVTLQWGVEVEDILLQQLELPQEMKRAMAQEAEAERSRRASVIQSRGEVQAAANLLKAAAILSLNKVAPFLRYLQVIKEIAPEPSEKIVLFVPPEGQGILSGLTGGKGFNIDDIRKAVTGSDEAVRKLEAELGSDLDGDGTIG